jgi:16S rRNA (adenine1518-N6/adenine1519-N6)-dimethyltransferase
MTGPLGPAATAELLERHGVRTTKVLGQHFLIDPNVVRRIVEIAGVGSGDNVLEIGAGAGTLTRALAESGARVVAYEVDERLRPVLLEVLDGVEVDLRFADATEADLAGLVGGERWTVVANLPYNVGTPLVLDLLRHAPTIERFVVMLQREAVERLAADPGSKTYGLPSVVCGLHGRVRIALRVPPHLFLPRPQVESAVAVIDRRPAPPESEAAIALAARAFGQRRKMLRRSLAGVVDAETFATAGIDSAARPEDLPPSAFVALAGAAA